MVSRLVSSRGKILSLYEGCRFLHSLIISPYRIIISIMETIYQELFINLYHELVHINQGICINVFICLISLFLLFFFDWLCSIISSNSFSTKYLNREDTQISYNKIIISDEDIECDGESTKNYQTGGQDGQEGFEKQEGNNFFSKKLVKLSKL